MSTGSIHGTDCFEVEAFIVRNEESKLFKVRHKTSGNFYVMEVASRKDNSHGLINTNLQETCYNLSKFWVNMKFAFQTSSKLYYILNYIGDRTLGILCGRHGPLAEVVVQFYASEILNALEELHSHGCVYGDLDLDNVYIDNTGHVVLWRTFCGKVYWTQEERVCNLYGYTNGRHCKSNHGKCLERDIKIDFQLLGLVILQMLSQEHYRIASSIKPSTQEGLARIASSLTLPSFLSVFSRDLITRLLKGQFYNASHIKTHPFFIGINWKMIQARLASPPTIAKTSFHPPALRKTSSEVCLYVEANTSSSSPYARPLTPATPTNYTNDLCTKTDQYITNPPNSTPHNLSQPSTRPAPPSRLRSALSSPDLSMLVREPDSRWMREPFEVKSSYHDFYYQPLDASRYVSQSMADLQSIHHSRTSSSSSTVNRNITTLNDGPRKISQHLSYPPGNRPIFERQHVYNYESSNHSGVYDSSYSSLYKVPSPIYGYDQYSRNNADHHYNKDCQQNSPRPSEFGQVISNGIARPFNMSSLHRAHSCSELNYEDKNSFGYMIDNRPRPISRPTTPNIENTERRKYYPLAQVPIPSFAEFKRKITSTDNKIDQKKAENNTFTSAITKTEHQTINRDDKHLKTISRERDLKKESKKETNTESKQRNGESMKDNYSHNDVIQNLMLKYGLYERSDKRKETRNSPTKTDKESRISSRVETFLESWQKKENLKNNEVISKREESSPSHRKEGRPSRGTPSMRRRASAAVVEQPSIAAPKLTRKSKSSLASDSLDKSDDINNNPTTPVAIEKGQSPRSSSISESRCKELASSKTDLTSIADVYKTTRQSSAEYSMSSSPENTSILIDEGDKKGGAMSKTLWEAAKIKLKLGKSPNASPLLKRKTKEHSNKDIRDNISNEGCGKMEVKDEPKRKRSPRRAKDQQADGNIPRRDSLEPSLQGQLQKGGIHTSLLSIASSICSTDNELDDSSSLQSDDRSCDRRRRWESFHSNISADSGSAQMFEFENDLMAVEDPFDDREPDEPMRQRSDSEIERTDSGIGGDIIAGRSKKQSWEDIVHKSSKHWSIVAASAHHWKEVALKSKLAKEAGVARRKSATATPISEDMKECPDCQKYHIPCTETSDRTTVTFRKNTTTICQKCCERRVERKEAIIELVQTEINYANDLQILKEEFYSPLQTGGILQPDSLSEIFLNFQELVEVSIKFSNRLQYALEESVSKGNEEFSQVNVGNIFMKSVDFFQSYEIYCTKQNAASALLESLQKKNELLKIFLNVTCRENPKCRKMDLNSFLLAPVQRIMKYPLLLSRIRKATPRRNQDREKLMQAQRKIEDQLNRINSLNSTVESKQKRYRGSGHFGRSDSLDKLQMKKMASEILNWTMGEMTLLMYGVFEVVIHDFISASGWSGRRGSKRNLDVFMLFCVLGLSEPKVIDSDEDTTIDEPLFPSDPEATDAALVMLKKKMNGKYTLFKEPLSLDSCIVCNHSDHKDCFEIINMAHETYIFKAASIKQSKKWLKHLRLQAKDLGAWKKRRNGLPNIMIKTI